MCRMTNCQKELSRYENDWQGFKPTCDEDGRYSSIQTNRKTDHQWCAIVPEHSSKPLTEKFRFIWWKLTADDAKKFRSTCDVFQTSQCAKEISKIAKKSFEFDFAATVKASQQCQLMINFCTICLKKLNHIVSCATQFSKTDLYRFHVKGNYHSLKNLRNAICLVKKLNFYLVDSYRRVMSMVILEICSLMKLQGEYFSV